MKKRIISLILVVVMLALSLVGCGYSFAKDDNILQHVTYDKAKLDKAIAAIKIADGDFTADHETRLKKIEDEINAALATASKDVEKKTEGVMGENDVLYYCYYVTFTDAKTGKTVYLAPDYMKVSKALTLQNGNFLTKLEKDILAKTNGFDFAGKTYSNDPKEGSRAQAGEIAFISYTYTYDTVIEKDGKQQVQTVTDKVALQMVTLDKNDPVHAALISEWVDKKDSEGNVVLDKDGNPEKTLSGLLIGSEAKEILIDEYVIKGETVKPQTLVKAEGSDEQTVEAAKVKITKAKIDFVATGEKFAEIKDVTYTEKKELKDIYQSQYDLKDVELTYHVYVTSYLPIIDLTAENIIKLVYGNNLSVSILAQILFGYDRINDEDMTEEELEKILSEYNSKFDFAAASKAFDDAAKAFNDAKKALADAESALAAAEKALADYKTANPDNADTIKTYEDAVAKCEDAVEEAKLDKAYAQEKMSDKYNVLYDANRINDVITFEQFANIVVQALKGYNTAKSGVSSAESTLNKSETTYVNAVDALDKAIKALDTNTKAYNDAKAKYESVKNSSNAEEVSAAEAAMKKAETEMKSSQDAKSKAENDKKTAEEAVKANKDAVIKAKATLKYAEEKKDIEVEKLLSFKTDIKEKIVSGYEKYLYESKQASYRADIKDELAKAVYKCITDNVKVNSVPEKALDMVYEQLMDKYQYIFYKEGPDADPNKKDENGNVIQPPSYYQQFNGNFKEFLKYYLINVEKSAKVLNTYDDACYIVRQQAIKDVMPIVQVYAVAHSYGLVLENKEYKETLKKTVEQYNEFMAMIGYADVTEDQYVEMVGELNLRTAFQFDKIMNYFLATEEIVDKNNSMIKTDKYTYIKHDFIEKK